MVSVIDHINDNKTDNCLSNLQLISVQKNKKAAKNRDYSFSNHPCRNRKLIRGINLDTNQFLYFNSFTSVQQHFGIIIRNVKRVCDNVKKSAFHILQSTINGLISTQEKLVTRKEQLKKEYIVSETNNGTSKLFINYPTCLYR